MGLRQEKFARQIQRDLGDIFLHHKDYVAGQFVTISQVMASPDLSYIKVYLSLFNSPKRAQVMQALELYSREIRMELAKKIRNQVKKVPELTFFEDDTLDYVQHMDEVFAAMKKNEDTDNNKQ